VVRRKVNKSERSYGVRAVGKNGSERSRQGGVRGGDVMKSSRRSCTGKRCLGEIKKNAEGTDVQNLLHDSVVPADSG